MRLKKKKMFLHIGTYKTGSTAIQEYLHTHQSELLTDGFLYPTSARPQNNRNNHGRLSLSIAHEHGFNPPAWYTETLTADEAFGPLLDEIAKTDIENIIVSSEEFVQLALRTNSTAAIEDLKSRLEDFDVTVLLYIREPFSLLKSWFNEVNKGPVGSRNFPTFFMNLKPGFLAQQKIYKEYAKVFGPEHLKVISYKKQGSDHIQEFLKVIGCRMDPPTSVVETQKAQSLDKLEIARLAKDRQHSFDEATISDIGSLADLKAKIAKINSEYEKISRLSDKQIESNLSGAAIMKHYAAMLLPARAFGPLNRKEADNLRDLAFSIEDTDPELSIALLEAAQVIKPNGGMIVKRLKRLNDCQDKTNNSDAEHNR